MAEYIITIANRIASIQADVELVCNNPADTIRFEFDAEWSDIAVKTARFSWEGKYIDVPFSGNVVKVPEIYKTNYVYVGVYADGITSTPAKVKCRYSIKCMGWKNEPPKPDVYDQIIALLNDLDSIDETEIAAAVKSYWDANPIVYEKHTDGIGPLVEIAETYFNVAYDEADQLAYYEGRGLFAPQKTDDDGVKSIVCSQFVQACIGGIDYLHSRYVKGANQRRPWGFVSDGSGEYSYDDEDEIQNNDYMDAGNQARYFEGLGQLKEFRATRNALQPGDLLFYTSKDASDKYKSIGHVAICLGASEKRHTFMHATDGYKRKVDGKEAGVMVSTKNYSDYAPDYYVRSPIMAEYTTQLVVAKTIAKNGEYNGNSEYIDKFVFEHALPAGFYTLKFDDAGNSLYGYIRAYYADGSNVIFDGNKNAGVNSVVFYAELPITQVDVRVATGSTYDCSWIKLYKGFAGN